MGKPTGFIEYLRELPVDRTPIERVRDWNEFHHHMDEKRLRQQGARCMDCGVPFCHTGKLISGMACGCPINNLIPEWNDLVYRGLWNEALDRLHKTNNFPEFTGRVCPAPCEGSCVLGINAPPVTIKNIEDSIIDRGWEEGWVMPEPPETRTGKKVAVIGSGPAGLARRRAAQSRPGHTVTVFERADRPGGLLDVRHPEHEARQEGSRAAPHQADGAGGHQVRLQRERRRERRAAAAAQGFRRHRALHRRDQAARSADRRPQAQGRSLRDGFPHREHQGRCSNGGADHSSDHARRARTSSSSAAATPAPTASAPRCATAARASCRSKFCRSRPWSAPTDNPWPEWPKVYKLDYGQEEAAAKFGADPRVYLTTVKKFVGDDRGQAEGSRHRARSSGRRTTRASSSRTKLPGTEKMHPAQLVLLAMGFLGPEQPLLEGSRRRDRPAQQRQSRARQVTRPASRASSPPATAAAARAWSSGPSTKAAAPRASATAT